ncbi:hypothetical protein [Paenibacillus sp. MMO-177]|uniref:hypothetical protein n=1 Tax=Paenibacillus sp. MMO-177 TaxID=3081289 RepID=UPI00301AC8A9
MASAAFRINKIVDAITKFRVRRGVLKNQLEQPEFEADKEYIRGQISALDQVIQDLMVEFDVEHPDRVDEPKRKREIIDRMISDGHHDAAKELDRWRDHRGNHWGWNGWLKGAYPSLANKYGVHDHG